VISKSALQGLYISLKLINHIFGIFVSAQCLDGVTRQARGFLADVAVKSGSKVLREHLFWVHNVSNLSCETEVANFGRAVRSKQDIRWLQIPVNDTCRVHVVNAAQNVEDNGLDLELRNLNARHHGPKQIGSLRFENVI
jgi:hypothetical protein